MEKMMNSFNLKSTDRCLIIAPHADDESLGCGGMLLKNNEACDVVVLTDGSKCGYKNVEEIKKIRLAEFSAAMDYAKIKNYRNLMIEDRTVRFNLNMLKSLNIDKYDYVFVPNEDENHVDHCCIYKEVCKLLRYSLKTKIVCYEVWTPLRKPNVYIDISDFIDKKFELISHYVSQIKNRDYANKMIGLNKYRGLECNKDYVEVFYLVNPFLQKILKLLCFEKNEQYFSFKLWKVKITHHFHKKSSEI